MRVTLFRDFYFEAAHRNLAAAAESPSSRLHGHSYRARVWVKGSVDNHTGWLLDFAEIKDAFSPVIATLDHRCLNDIEGMQDSSLTDLQRGLEIRLRGVLPSVERCAVEIVGDQEFRPVIEPDDRLSIARKKVSFWFSAAHFLPALPVSHKCRSLHGHSFHIEVVAPDAHDLVGRLEGVYPRLDHRSLNEIPGLENPTSENLSRWLWEELAAAGGQPHEVIVQETCTTGCVYTGQ
jgi:6-pyruvoyltetrahydropterin/6-carboxytetrahydropterin synthase